MKILFLLISLILTILPCLAEVLKGGIETTPLEAKVNLTIIINPNLMHLDSLTLHAETSMFTEEGRRVVSTSGILEGAYILREDNYFFEGTYNRYGLHIPIKVFFGDIPIQNNITFDADTMK